MKSTEEKTLKIKGNKMNWIPIKTKINPLKSKKILIYSPNLKENEYRIIDHAFIDRFKYATHYAYITKP